MDYIEWEKKIRGNFWLQRLTAAREMLGDWMMERQHLILSLRMTQAALDEATVKEAGLLKRIDDLEKELVAFKVPIDSETAADNRFQAAEMAATRRILEHSSDMFKATRLAEHYLKLGTTIQNLQQVIRVAQQHADGEVTLRSVIAFNVGVIRKALMQDLGIRAPWLQTKIKSTLTDWSERSTDRDVRSD